MSQHRYKQGHIPGNAVLTPQNAVEIRELYAKGETMLDIAITYGICTAHVSDIVRRKKWKNAEQQVLNDQFSLGSPAGTSTQP